MPMNRAVLLKDRGHYGGHWIAEGKFYKNGTWKLEHIIGHVPQQNLENFRGKFGTNAVFRNDEPVNWEEYRTGKWTKGNAEEVIFDNSGSERV